MMGGRKAAQRRAAATICASAVAAAATAAGASTAPALLFCGAETNDVYRAAVTAAAKGGASGAVKLATVDGCVNAALALPNKSGVLLVADGAPAQLVPFPYGLIDVLATRDVRMYAEFAMAPPKASFVGLDRWPCPAFTRVVANPGSELWGPHSSTQPLDVLEPNACSYVPYFETPSAPSASGATSADGRSGAENENGNTATVSTTIANAATAAGSPAHLVLAKVAGFATAVYGLNGTATTPVLVTPRGHPGLLLSSLAMSVAQRARLSPAAGWQAMWRDLLAWLLFQDGDRGGGKGGAVSSARNRSSTQSPTSPPSSQSWTRHLTWFPVVGPRYSRDAALPPNATADAVRAALRWVHTGSGLLATRAAFRASSVVGVWAQGLGQASLAATGWPTELASLDGCGNGSGGGGGGDGAADGAYGVFECYMSNIQPRGGGVGGQLATQLLRPVVRTDCVGEAAGGLAVGAWREIGDGRAATVAANLLDFLLFNSSARAWPRSDPSSAVGGTLQWAVNINPPHSETIYADDQARIFYSAAFAGAALGVTRWERPLVELLLGNFRLMNAAGYFRTSVTADAVVAAGWRGFHDNDTSTNENSYYQAAGRAAMLLGYRLTGQRVLLDRTVIGLSSSMGAFYKGDLVCQVGLTSEAARMLLPLAWLVRINNTETHRKWVTDVAAVLLARQQPCGAIQEFPFGQNDSATGRPRQCEHHPPTSNAEYGTGESTMSQTASDPASDLLYSNNFALHALHEAAAATGDPALAAAAAKLRDFAVRAQAAVSAEGFAPEDARKALRVDGAWLRSFDYVRWEQYAQGSDWAWGPWVAETGHGVSLLTMALAAMERGTTMWDAVTGDAVTRRRWAALADELVPLYLGGH